MNLIEVGRAVLAEFALQGLAVVASFMPLTSTVLPQQVLCYSGFTHGGSSFPPPLLLGGGWMKAQ